MDERNTPIEALFTQYLSRELDEETRVRFERELDANPSLRAELETSQRLRVQLRGAVAGQYAPEQLQSRVLHSLSRGRAPLLWGRLQLVGALAFGILIAVVSWQLLRTPSTLLDELPPSVVAVLQIGIGKHVSCVKERIGSPWLALGAFSSPLPPESKRLLDAAELALPRDFQVVERHVCGTEDRRFGHLVLVKDNVYLSVLVTDRKPEDPELPTDSRLASAVVDGMQIYAVRQDGLDVGTFALPTLFAFVVSDASPGQNLRYTEAVAAAFKRVQ
ncbi:MAG: hypothetical protein MUF01_11975 [Bryobacterales bacterium]|jgi:hypothetical protein|nr:hypothetical protein [Bryobacterales bacterium]